MAAGTFVRWAVRHGIARALLTRAARRGDLQGMIVMDPRVRANPYEVYDAVRERGRLVRGQIALLTADYEVCRTVLRSEAFGTAMSPEGLPPPFRRVLSHVTD